MAGECSEPGYARGEEGDQGCLGAAREAHRGVDRVSEARADVERHRAARVRPVAQTARLLQRDVAVCHERAEAGEPHLAAVRVPGEDHVGAEIDEGVEHPPVRGVRHSDREGGGCDVGAELLEEVGKHVQPIPAAVRVADAERVDPEPADIEGADRVVQIEPAQLIGQVPVERLGVERFAGRLHGRRTGEVPKRVAR